MKNKKLWRIGSEEQLEIEKCIKTGLNGSTTKKFEINFARRFNAKYAISLNSGTSALHVALLAIGINKDDEVIVPPLSFIATAYAPIFCNAVPVFADIEEDTFNISPRDIEKKITKKTKAIIAVSLYGLPSNLESIKKIAKKNNLKLIEDNAECILGKCNNKNIGTFGDISIFSFQRSKHLTTGDGGMLITNNIILAKNSRKYADLGYRRLTANSISNEDIKTKIQHYSYKRHGLIGYNYRMPDVCSAIGLAQLKKMNMLVNRRIQIANIYINVLKKYEWIKIQHVPKNFKSSYWTLVFIINKKDKNIWDKFRSKFIKNGGDPFYGAWALSYNEPSLKKIVKISNKLCPIANKIQPKIIQLKTNYESITKAKSQSKILQRTLDYFD